MKAISELPARGVPMLPAVGTCRHAGKPRSCKCHRPAANLGQKGGHLEDVGLYSGCRFRGDPRSRKRVQQVAGRSGKPVEARHYQHSDVQLVDFYATPKIDICVFDAIADFRFVIEVQLKPWRFHFAEDFE
jgi:hypothetical protein